LTAVERASSALSKRPSATGTGTRSCELPEAPHHAVVSSVQSLP
jgi:hypothetical protein